jgi:hypothetical protein
MAARLIRTWFDDLCQFKIGAIAPLILCGIVLGAVIGLCMHKPPAAGKQDVQSSSGQVHAACQGGIPAASAAPQLQQPDLVAQGQLPAPPSPTHCEPTPNAYNILEPDWVEQVTA